MTNPREVSPSGQKELKEAKRAHQSGSSGDFFRPDQSGSSGQKESQEAERGHQQEVTRRLFIRATSPGGDSEKRLLVNPEKPRELVYGEEARFMLIENEKTGAGLGRPDEQKMDGEKFEAVKQALLVNGEKSYTDPQTGWKFDLIEDTKRNQMFDPIRGI